MTTGSRTVTATDTVSILITDESNAVTVTAAAANHFTIVTPGAATAGVPFNFTLNALDQFNNPATGFTGTVAFTSTDPAVSPGSGLPNNYTFTTGDQGTHTFSATLVSLGSRTITATNNSPSFSVTSDPIIVSGTGVTTHFSVSAPASATAGTAFSVTITALDGTEALVASYNGTVNLTATDGQTVTPATATLVNGIATFNVTLKTTGTPSLIARDSVSPSISGTSNSITVVAAKPQLFVVAPSPVTAGNQFSFTVTARDQFNNLATNYTGFIQFTSTDANDDMPANSQLTNGTGNFNATLKTAGNHTITASDTVDATINGTSNNIAVAAGTATRFTVSGTPTTITAGSMVSFTVTALDAFNNTANGYAGTVIFGSSDTTATFPPSGSLTGGIGTFAVTFRRSGNQFLTAEDSVNSGINGTSNAITVNAGAATRFGVTAPTTATAGSSFNFSVTAFDAFDNTATGYTGLVRFTTPGSVSQVPGDSALTNGQGNFSATLETAGNRTIVATDTVTSSINGTSNNIAVSAAAATRFTITAPGGVTAGQSFSITVTAFDQFNNTATGYSGSINFTSTDGQAVLPPPASTLTGGTRVFTGVILKTAGVQTITGTDTLTPSILGTSGPIGVSPTAATNFLVTGPSNVSSGQQFAFTVTARDQFNNTATGYTGTVDFASSDGQATTPPNTTLTSGFGSFIATLKQAGPQTISATDTVATSITGVSNPITVSSGAATKFLVSAQPTATAGVQFSFTVTALDAGDNVVTGYSGTVAITATGQSILPPNSALTNGTGSFNITLKSAGNQTITATDTQTASITGSDTVSVVAGAATRILLDAPANAATNSQFSFTVTAFDQFDNTATGYAGTVAFTSSDPGTPTLPGPSTLTNGTGTFTATLKTPGSQTLTATDGASPSLTSTDTINVSTAQVTSFLVSHCQRHSGYAVQLHRHGTGSVR